MPKDVRKAAVAILRANASLIALGVGNQISSQYAPASFSGVWITMRKVSGKEDSAHDGNANLSFQRWQLDVSSSNKALVDSVILILINEFNAVTYTAFEGLPTETKITFFHESDDEAWEESPRMYMGSVDLNLQAETV
jgi:hypothetical protein